MVTEKRGRPERPLELQVDGPPLLTPGAAAVLAELIRDYIDGSRQASPDDRAPDETPPTKGAEARLMTPPEVADYLGVPVASLYGWPYQGKGPRAHRIGRHLRYRMDELEEWVAHQP